MMIKKTILALSILALIDIGIHAIAQATHDPAAAQHLAQKKASHSDISQSKGPRSCSATSGDGKKSCSVSCKENESAYCSNTEKTVECYCR